MRVKAKNLLPGMLLVHDLVDRGSVILRRGSVLSAGLISTILKRGIKAVDVEGDGTLTGSAGMDQVLGLGGQNYEDYRRRKDLINKMFADISDGDGQMQTLKYCIMGLLEESLQSDE